MKKAMAHWHVQCNVTCPHCESYLDLIEIIDDDWEVLPETATTDNEFTLEQECPDCDKTFLVEGVEYS